PLSRSRERARVRAISRRLPLSAPQLLPDRTQFLRRDQVLVPPQRLFRRNQIIETDRAYLAPEQFDLDRFARDTLVCTDTGNTPEHVERPEIGIQIQIVERNAAIGLVE